jgi:hypothetical protein
MQDLITLKTNGYELRFYLSYSKNNPNSFFDSKIQFLTNSDSLQKISVISEKVLIKFESLISLVNYFRNHINKLKSNSEEVSIVFVDTTLSYQIHALSGEAFANIEDSYFSINSMVNIGKAIPSGDSVYIGGESTVSFNQIENFITSLEKLLYDCSTES